MAVEVQKIQLAEDLTVYANPSAKMEVEFIYKEIFVDHCYDLAELPSDALIIDAGGNIGMFSLYMKRKYPNSTILAFEPAPDTFDTFQRNMQLHDITGVDAHRCGLGRAASNQTLTFYPNLPGNSTLYLDDKKQQLEAIPSEHPVAQAMVESRAIQVEIKPLSAFLDAAGIGSKRVSLLKIDVEGAEVDVLYGIDDAQWDRIDNVVVEICDTKGDFKAAETLLKSKGFEITSEKAPWAPENFPMFMMIAKRSSS